MESVRYFYRDEGRRRITVAYTYDQRLGNVAYGASVFRQDSPDEVYVKREHRHTAEHRLALCPVRIQLDLADVTREGPNGQQSRVESLIRSAMMVHGVRGERLVNRGKLADPQGLPEGVQVCIGLDPNWPGRESYVPFPGEKVEEEVPSSEDLEKFAEQLFGALPPGFIKLLGG